MNITGDSEDHAELMPPGVPMAAPVPADMLQAPTGNSYPSYSGVPAQAAQASPGVPPDLHTPPGILPSLTPPPAPGIPPAASGAEDDPPVPHVRPDAEPAPADAPPPAGHETAVGRGGHDFAPEPPAHAEYLITGSPPGKPPEDPNRVIVRKHLDALRLRAANASSWLEASVHYAALVNHEGTVPVTARFTRDDIEFLGRAREEVLGFAEFGLRLLELHAPLDAGGISTDPSSPILRCRSCMWRWPCPTFSVLGEAISQLPYPGAPGAR